MYLSHILSNLPSIDGDTYMCAGVTFRQKTYWGLLMSVLSGLEALALHFWSHCFCVHKRLNLATNDYLQIMPVSYMQALYMRRQMKRDREALWSAVHRCVTGLCKNNTSFSPVFSSILCRASSASIALHLKVSWPLILQCTKHHSQHDLLGCWMNF